MADSGFVVFIDGFGDVLLSITDFVIGGSK